MGDDCTEPEVPGPCWSLVVHTVVTPFIVTELPGAGDSCTPPVTGRINLKSYYYIIRNCTLIIEMFYEHMSTIDESDRVVSIAIFYIIAFGLVLLSWELVVNMAVPINVVEG